MQLFRTILVRLALLSMLAASLRAGWFAYTSGDMIRGVVAGLAGALAIIAIIIHVLVSRWNRRFESRMCPACGYDLRAAPDRCPECGHEVTDSETTLPRWLNGTALDLARDHAAVRETDKPN